VYELALTQQQQPPRRSAFSLERLEYVKVALEVIILLVALPWIIRDLRRDASPSRRYSIVK